MKKHKMKIYYLKTAPTTQKKPEMTKTQNIFEADIALTQIKEIDLSFISLNKKKISHEQINFPQVKLNLAALKQANRFPKIAKGLELPQHLDSYKTKSKEIRLRIEPLKSDLKLATASTNREMMKLDTKIGHFLTLAQWNLRGLGNESKAHIINRIHCDILTLQEIGHPADRSLNHIHKNKVNFKERDITKRGGGTMTLSNLRISNIKEYNINKDCNLIRIILDNVFVIWLGNIYLNRGSPKQVTKHSVLFKILS